MANQSLTDKTVVITGAGAGIGWGIAQACADAGARIIMAEINPNREDRAEALRQTGAEVYFRLVDVSSIKSIDELCAWLGQNFESIDGLVNNAGVTIEGDFLDFSVDHLEKLWSTNLRSVFLMCQRVARLMKPQGSGTIVNVSSNHAIASVPGYEMYSATKGGIDSMTRSMCWSLGQYGIRVNTICPGLTQTEVIADMINQRPELKNTFESMHATGSYNTVGQIGDIAVFLLSEASQALAGATLVADHGMVAGLCNVDDLK